jgi:hypothetical protein
VRPFQGFERGVEILAVAAKRSVRLIHRDSAKA